MKGQHVKDKEGEFYAMNIAPDFCIVNGDIIAYDIARDLTHELDYEHSMLTRSAPVLKRYSTIQGVDGNGGKGIHSGVSLEAGNNLAIQGSSTVLVKGQPVCRHWDFVLMNGK